MVIPRSPRSQFTITSKERDAVPEPAAMDRVVSGFMVGSCKRLAPAGRRIDLDLARAGSFAPPESGHSDKPPADSRPAGPAIADRNSHRQTIGWLGSGIARTAPPIGLIQRQVGRIAPSIILTEGHAHYMWSLKGSQR